MTGQAQTASRASGDADGTVFDIGYQRYGGPRQGRNRGRLAVFKDGVRIALGLGRGPRAKFLPWFFIGVLVALGVYAKIWEWQQPKHHSLRPESIPSLRTVDLLFV